MKLSLKLNKNNFSDLLNKLQNLSNIDDTVKMKIDQDGILLYSMLSNESAVLALKSFQLKTSEYFDNFNNSESFDFIITNAGKFVKNLKFFNTENPIKLEINSKKLAESDVYHVRSAVFSNGKLKISAVGGEEFKIRDLNSAGLQARLNPKLSKWKFKISKDDFSDVKKLSNINSEDKILHITVQNGVVTINDSTKWELEVDKITQKNEQLIFSKKYLSNINDDKDFIEFTIFETFILIRDDSSNLMLSFEQNFEE